MSPGSRPIPASSLLRSLGFGTLITFFLSFGGCLGELPVHPAPNASATPAATAAGDLQDSPIFPHQAADAGICSLRVPGMMPQQLYQEQDESSVRLIGVAPGLYLQVLALAPDGWYRVQAPPVEGGAGATGWLHAVDGLNLYGPCEDLPQLDPLRLESSPPLTPGWKELRDPRTGVGLVLPCFWRADLPALDEYGAGRTGTLRNFTLFPLEHAFVEDIFEAGAIQVDLSYLRRDVPGATAFQRMTALAAELGQGPRELRTLEINGQPALQVAHDNASGRGRSTLFELPDRTFLLFTPNAGASDHPDVLAILSSIALSPQTLTLAPRLKPAPPPFEADASCLWGDLEGEGYHKADSEGSTP